MKLLVPKLIDPASPDVFVPLKEAALPNFPVTHEELLSVALFDPIESGAVVPEVSSKFH